MQPLNIRTRSPAPSLPSIPGGETPSTAAAGTPRSPNFSEFSNPVSAVARQGAAMRANLHEAYKTVKASAKAVGSTVGSAVDYAVNPSSIPALAAAEAASAALLTLSTASLVELRNQNPSDVRVTTLFLGSVVGASAVVSGLTTAALLVQAGAKIIKRRHSSAQHQLPVTQPSLPGQPTQASAPLQSSDAPRDLHDSGASMV